MKKTFTTLFIAFFVLTLCTAFVVKYKNGNIAGYTGSPGEQTCAGGNCHGGGTSTVKSISVSAKPSFSNGKYFPDSVYTISLTVSANGTAVTQYGFGCEILNTSDVSTGTLQSAGASGGAQFLTALNGRRNATHAGPRAGTASATFSFIWKAPAAGEGDVTIYACGNAVNGNTTTAGDSPIPMTPLTLAEGTVAVVQPTTDTGLGEQGYSAMSRVSVFPNPSSGASQISYFLTENTHVSVELTDISGKLVKQLISEKENPGQHQHALNFHGVTAGVYFVRTSVEGRQIAQRLMVVN